MNGMGRMSFFSCETMRRLVVYAGSLFLSGVVLAFLSNLLATGEIPASPYLLYLAFFLALAGPMLLLSTVVLALFPGNRERMGVCRR